MRIQLGRYVIAGVVCNMTGSSYAFHPSPVNHKASFKPSVCPLVLVFMHHVFL